MVTLHFKEKIIFIWHYNYTVHINIFVGKWLWKKTKNSLSEEVILLYYHSYRYGCVCERLRMWECVGVCDRDIRWEIVLYLLLNTTSIKLRRFSFFYYTNTLTHCAHPQAHAHTHTFTRAHTCTFSSFFELKELRFFVKTRRNYALESNKHKQCEWI